MYIKVNNPLTHKDVPFFVYRLVSFSLLRFGADSVTHTAWRNFFFTTVCEASREWFRCCPHLSDGCTVDRAMDPGVPAAFTEPRRHRFLHRQFVGLCFLIIKQPVDPTTLRCIVLFVPYEAIAQVRRAAQHAPHGNELWEFRFTGRENVCEDGQ